jgi:hypothetical protein
LIKKRKIRRRPTLIDAHRELIKEIVWPAAAEATADGKAFFGLTKTKLKQSESAGLKYDGRPGLIQRISWRPAECTCGSTVHASINAHTCPAQERHTWGGGIELAILASHYHREIAAWNIETAKSHVFGEEAGYTKMVCVINIILYY